MLALVQTEGAGDDEEMQRFVPIEDVFKGRYFDRQIIVLCVSWYTSFKLSLRDLVIMMGDRGISVTHTTILRWVQRYLPEFEKRWRRYARPVGESWRMDEGIVKLKQIPTIFRQDRPTPGPRINKLAVVLGGETANKFPKLTIPRQGMRPLQDGQVLPDRLPTISTFKAFREGLNHRNVGIKSTFRQDWQ